jgi:signal transduction histidine kinase
MLRWLPEQRWLQFIWIGPPSLLTSLRLEWRIALVRWIGIVCVALGLPYSDLSHQQLQSADAILVVGAVYNFALQVLILRSPRLIAQGYVPSIGDALLNIGMLYVAGGFDTPLSYMLFSVIIATAMRFGYGPAIAAAVCFVAADVTINLVGQHPLGSGLFFRAGFLTMTAVLAGYLREQARRAESALETRLRQANLLNEATARLGASLEIETVLNAATGAAARLFRSSGVVLFRGETVDEGPSFVRFPDSISVEDGSSLRSLCRRYMSDSHSSSRGMHMYVQQPLPTGRNALVFALCSQSRPAPLATIALVLPPGVIEPDLDGDIIESFLKRMTLAIENATFYRSLTTRTSDLQGAYADLEQAHRDLLRVDEMKTDFLANVSHEFRTPLTSIRSFSELLLTYGDTPETQREFIEIINSESDRLTRMVNDVLDITKIESGNMDWQMSVLDLGDLVQDTARAYRQMIESQNLWFEVEVEHNLPAVYGDRDRLRQVISNLLGNASKFTAEGGIRLCAGRQGEEVLVRVVDTGIGIHRDDHARVFEKFQQLGAVLTNKPRGTGLGLSICRQIVEFHSGRIWVDSNLGTGSTFGFALPSLKPASLSSEPERRLTTTASRLGFLVNSE